MNTTTVTMLTPIETAIEIAKCMPGWSAQEGGDNRLLLRDAGPISLPDGDCPRCGGPITADDEPARQWEQRIRDNAADVEAAQAANEL